MGLRSRMIRAQKQREMEAEYFEAVIELEYRTSNQGKPFHDAASVEAQYQRVLELNESLLNVFDKKFDMPSM